MHRLNYMLPYVVNNVKVIDCDNDDVCFNNELYEDLNGLVDFSQAFSIDEFQNIGISKYKSDKK